MFYVAYAYSRGFGAASVTAVFTPSRWEHVQQFRDVVAELPACRRGDHRRVLDVAPHRPVTHPDRLTRPLIPTPGRSTTRMNATLNLGRAQVLRAVANWLDANPTLPVEGITLTKRGDIEVTAAEADSGACVEREVRGLYALADTVGAEVILAPVGYRNGGWWLECRWTVGVLPLASRVLLSRAAADVRALPAAEAARKAS